LHGGADVVRQGPKLDLLIELRDCTLVLSDLEPELGIGVIENVLPRIEAAIAWLAQPRCISSLSCPADASDGVPLTLSE
jgi:hypothetical protein